MGRYRMSDDLPLEVQLKGMEDDELLDFWEETQVLERFLSEEAVSDTEYSIEYERLILMELQLRSCRKTHF